MASQNKTRFYFSDWFLPVIIFIVLLVTAKPMFHHVPLWLTEIYKSTIPPSSQNGETTTGPMGDTFGGMVGPIIGLIGVYLTFLAFWMQYRANRIQLMAFDAQKQQLELEEAERKTADRKQEAERARQDYSVRLDRFETRFFELLRLHRDNVTDIKIVKTITNFEVTKRKAFVSMFNEYRYTYWACRNIYLNAKKRKEIAIELSPEETLRLSYILFYAGIGKNSDVITSSMLRQFDSNLVREIKVRLAAFKDSGEYPEYTDEDGNEVVLTIQYVPWGGHQSRIGHYYRHLFQTVKYVATQDNDFLSKSQKLEYLKILRAQLSDFEQLMLYYNAVAGFGSSWIRDVDNNNCNYFVDYYMIHNIPLPLANFGIRPNKKFQKELERDPKLFEWFE